MNQKRVIAFLFFSLMLFSLFATFALAQDPVPAPTPSKPASVILDPVISLFTNWEKAELSLNLAKYLFWFIVTLFVFSVIAYIPVLKNLHGGARFLLALVIGFLSTAYITPSDIYTSLAGYSALGFVLSALLPLVILLFFSIEISKEGGLGGRMISKFMWFAFVAFLVWKLFDGMFGITSGAKVISLSQGWTYIGVIAFSVIWVLFIQKQFLKMIFKEEGRAMLGASARDLVSSLEAEIARRDERSQQLSGSAKTSYDQKTETLRKELVRVQKKIE